MIPIEPANYLSPLGVYHVELGTYLFGHRVDCWRLGLWRDRWHCGDHREDLFRRLPRPVRNRLGNGPSRTRCLIGHRRRCSATEITRKRFRVWMMWRSDLALPVISSWLQNERQMEQLRLSGWHLKEQPDGSRSLSNCVKADFHLQHGVPTVEAWLPASALILRISAHGFANSRAFTRYWVRRQLAARKSDVRQSHRSRRF